MAFCQQCGTKIAEEAAFCERCGAAVNFGHTQLSGSRAPAPAQSPRRSLVGYLFWAGAAILAVGLIFVILIAIGVKKGVERGVEDSGKDAADTAAKQLAGPIQIAAVLKRDKELSEAMVAAVGQTSGTTDERADRAAELMHDYVVEAGQAQMNSCPPDFVEAYHQYLSFWSDEANLLSSHPHIPSEDEAFVNGFFQGLAGDLTTVVVQQQEINAWIQRVKAGLNEIQRAHDIVARVAKADVGSVK